jgi:hypothetical protein
MPRHTVRSTIYIQGLNKQLGLRKELRFCIGSESDPSERNISDPSALCGAWELRLAFKNYIDGTSFA